MDTVFAIEIHYSWIKKVKIRTYQDATAFLDWAQDWLEEQAAAISLMLDLAFRLQRQSGLTDPLYLGTVEADGRSTPGIGDNHTFPPGKT